jgi:hypothetical protein
LLEFVSPVSGLNQLGVYGWTTHHRPSYKDCEVPSKYPPSDLWGIELYGNGHDDGNCRRQDHQPANTKLELRLSHWLLSDTS